MKPLRSGLSCFCFILAMVLASCAVPPSGASRSRTGDTAFAQAPQDRPGLGTRWGETRASHVADTYFHRANGNRAAAVASIYYNDAAGIRAMSGATASRRRWPVLSNSAARLVRSACGIRAAVSCLGWLSGIAGL